MENTVYLDLWDENDGIYISFDESISFDIFNEIAEVLSVNLIIDEISSYCVFISCNDPSWSDLGDARRDVTKIITELGYEVVWL